MTETLISLISILLGIIAVQVFAKLKTNYSLGITANCIVGVFGSILFVKLFGRLFYIAPNHIVLNSTINFVKLFFNFFISGLGGILLLYTIKKLKVDLD